MRILRTPTLILCVLALMAPGAQARTWVWQADNHQEQFSLFTDRTSVFEMGGFRPTWLWDEYSPGTVYLQSTVDYLGRSFDWGEAISSDFGEAWDLRRGITMTARAKPVDHNSQYSFCITVRNASTMGLPSNSTHLYVGWQVPDWVRFYDGSRDEVGRERVLRQAKPDVKYYLEKDWLVWTIGAKRIGDTVAWDVWLNGDHQDPSQIAPDGTEHTFVYATDYPEPNVSGTGVSVGNPMPILRVLETVFDYVAVTNDGVIPGWDGGDLCPNASGRPDIPEQRNWDFVKDVYRARDLMDAQDYFAAKAACDEALAKYDLESDFRATETMVVFISRVAKIHMAQAIQMIHDGRYQEAVDLIDETLTNNWNLPLRYYEMLTSVKLGAMRSMGRNAEALSEAVRAFEERPSPGLGRLIGHLYRSEPAKAKAWDERMRKQFGDSYVKP